MREFVRKAEEKPPTFEELRGKPDMGPATDEMYRMTWFLTDSISAILREGKTPELRAELAEKSMNEFMSAFKDGMAHWVKGECMMEKAAGGAEQLFVPIRKADDEKRIVYGVVMEPESVDAHGDIYSVEECEAACERFMTKSWSEPRWGLQHTLAAPEGVQVVESAIARSDFTLGDEVVKKGSWYVGLKVPESVWTEIKKGTFTGFSIGAYARVEKLDEQPAS